jgi:alpha-L-rhamnosidase
MRTESKKFSLSIIIIALSTLFSGSCSSGKKDISVYNLRCEYLQDPLGMDIHIPRFSWNMISAKRGVEQSAYRILVSDDRKNLLKEVGNIWDSGIEASNSNVNIIYEGDPIESGITYYWSVCIWDKAGNQSSWSEPAFFHTGILNENEWKAKWITSGDTLQESPMLRKEFQIKKHISEAFAYVTGLG